MLEHVELLQEVLWYVEEQNDFLMLNDLKPFAGRERFKDLQVKICRQIIKIITQQNAKNNGKSDLLTANPQSKTTLELVPFGYQHPNAQLQPKVNHNRNDIAVSNHKQRRKSKHKEKTLNKKYKCDICLKSYNKWKDFKRHLETHEDEIIDVESVQEDNSCITLPQVANDTSETPVNQPKSGNTELVQDPKPFKCTHCEVSFAKKNDLHVHNRNRHKRSGIFCDICKSVFTYKFEFDLHMTDHRDQMEHKCKVCGYSFEDENKLKKHLQIHMPKNSYHVCDKCNAAFSDKTALENHIKTTIHPRKFNCKECSEKFSCRNQLMEHNRLKHKKHKKLYKCQKCFVHYSKRFYLDKHYMNAHDIYLSNAVPHLNH